MSSRTRSLPVIHAASRTVRTTDRRQDLWARYEPPLFLDTLFMEAGRPGSWSPLPWTLAMTAERGLPH